MKTTASQSSASHYGFTLIELLVVISIIALLVSILLPSLATARQQAQSSVCLANLKRISTSMVLYMQDNYSMFPPFRLKKARATDAEGYRDQWGRKSPRWQWFVADDIQPIIDPGKYGAVPPNGNAAFDAALEMDSEYFVDPSLADNFARDVRNGAYGYNYQYLGNSRIHNGKFDNWPVNESRVRSPSQTILIGDSRGGGIEHGFHSYALDPPRLAFEKNATKFGPDSSDGIEFSPVELRHRGSGNVSFVDAHAESMNYARLGYAVDANGVVISMEGPSVVGASNRLWNGLGRDPYGQMNP